MNLKRKSPSKLIFLLFVPGFVASREYYNKALPSTTILASTPQRFAPLFDQGFNDFNNEDKIADDNGDRSTCETPELPKNHSGNGPSPPRKTHSPVIYRYFGKRRSRTRALGSIPFILLGPNVDHWRGTGENLAARGFSVIACERDPAESDDDTGPSSIPNRWMDNNNNKSEWWQGHDGEAANLVSDLMQATRWSKAILVACDSEAVVAIQAAFSLAPEKIAGLVLCGDLSQVHSLLQKSHPDLVEEGTVFAIDAFLSRLIPCPFAVAWDGESPPKMAPPSEYDGSSPAECLNGNRCFILGGGIAPHRRQPETFAWTLTRFVEGKVAPVLVPPEENRGLFGHVAKEAGAGDGVPPPPPLANVGKRMLSHTFISEDFFSSGSFVVYGRIIAFALLYGSMLKVAIFQYGNFLDGAVNLKTRLDLLKSLKGGIFGLLSVFFRKFGFLPRLFGGNKGNPEPDSPAIGCSEQGDDIGSEKDLNTHYKEGEASEEASSDPTPESAESDSEPGDTETNESTVEDSSPDEEETDSQDRNFFPQLFFLDRVVAMESGNVEQRT